nr:hypothetical protein [Pseudomonas putida]
MDDFDTRQISRKRLALATVFPNFAKFLFAVFIPQQKDRAEGILRREARSTAFLFTISMGINTFGQQSASFITQRPRFTQTNFGIATERDTFLLAQPVITEMPAFTTDRRND